MLFAVGVRLLKPASRTGGRDERLLGTYLVLERISAYCNARKRVRLDIGDPIVANRYLLWGMFGIFQVVCSPIIVPMYAGCEANRHSTLGTDVALGIFEILAASITCLAFFAPSFYCNWIEKGTSSANAEKGS
ncbi:MAG: hypothetical protein JRE43_06990 [Deltaproteobacteria bacterium]|nr:hypothetical protein [Deltaproteobacteria bacterium]MBW2543260.1 hypothetical protein [Deltaproteobacteria bacterium]